MKAGDRAGVVETLEGLGAVAIQSGTGFPGIALIDAATLKSVEHLHAPRPRRLGVRDEAAARLSDLNATTERRALVSLDEVAHLHVKNSGMSEDKAGTIALDVADESFSDGAPIETA